MLYSVLRMVVEGMNEDGSFIGQYGKQKRHADTSSGGFATLV